MIAFQLGDKYGCNRSNAPRAWRRIRPLDSYLGFAWGVQFGDNGHALAGMGQGSRIADIQPVCLPDVNDSGKEKK